VPALSCHTYEAFSRGMKPGDIIVAKKGTRTYIGYGIVITDYLYDYNRKDYHHFRKVSWKSKANGLK